MTQVDIGKINGFIFLLVLFLLSISSIYFFTKNWPEQENYFFELGLLDSNNRTENYFVNENSKVFIGTPNNWNIYVSNHMGTEQNIVVRVKIINLNTTGPNDRGHIPCPSLQILEFLVSLKKDEIQIIPFHWSILDIVTGDNGSIIRQMIINDDIYNVNIEVPDEQFRIIFELWVSDDVGNYEFGWYDNGDFHSVSVYLWANLGV